MPHLLIERLRLFKPLDFLSVRPVDFPYQEFFIELLDFAAAVIFVIGSVCFLPQYEKILPIYLAGCALFVVGAVIYLAISLFTLLEAWQHHKGWSSEVIENCLYVAGAWVFLIGTILYWPEKAQYEHIELMKDYALGQYFNLFTPQLEGTILFIVGSFLFAFAAVTNALNHRNFERDLSNLLIGVTAADLAADILFIVGSVAFLPDIITDNHKAIFFGAWAYIIGSMLLVFGSLISMYRTIKLWRKRKLTQLFSTPVDKVPVAST